MATYKKESHFRSVIKGITWRLVATTDIILIVLLVTCLTGNCNFESAIKIGFLEFLIKLIIYYVHERIWQSVLKDNVATKKETLQKTITWRIIATTTTFIISGTVLNNFNEVVIYIALLELVTKFGLYYLHERLWAKIPVGKVRRFFYKEKE